MLRGLEPPFGLLKVPVGLEPRSGRLKVLTIYQPYLDFSKYQLAGSLIWALKVSVGLEPQAGLLKVLVGLEQQYGLLKCQRA